jgi:hypothetical protein
LLSIARYRINEILSMGKKRRRKGKRVRSGRWYRPGNNRENRGSGSSLEKRMNKRSVESTRRGQNGMNKGRNKGRKAMSSGIVV